jgi:CXXX repeat modification system protein
MDNKKSVGNVTKDECSEIKLLHGRKTSLIDLKLTVDELPENVKEELYHKIEMDMKIIEESMNEWWKLKFDKYKWEKSSRVFVEFGTGKVFKAEN